LGFSISQPYEVALAGETREAGMQPSMNTVYAAYLPDKEISGCAPDGAALLFALPKAFQNRGGPVTP
jgi:hypothetical protein